jgi:hypothetical protein
MVQLVPSQTNYTAQQLGKLMFEEIYKYHGLLKSIIQWLKKLLKCLHVFERLLWCGMMT